MAADPERFRDAFQVARHSPDPASVEDAIEQGRAVLAGDDVAERGTFLCDLGGLLQIRYHQTGDFGYLQEAIQDVTEAYLLAYEQPATSARCANNLGMLHHTAFRANRDRRTLADALDWSRTAVDETPPETKAFYLGNLVVALRTAFTETRDPDFLAEAVDHARAAVESSLDDVDASRSLHFLATVLLDWIRDTGDTAVLAEAVDAARRAVDRTPAGSSDVLDRLVNLGRLLEDRHSATGAREDLAELLRVRQAVVAHTPVTDRRHSHHLVDLTTTERAWTALTGEHPNPRSAGWERTDSEAEACGRYAAEFRQTLDPARLEEAIALGRSAMAATPAGHPRRGVRLDHFATALTARGEVLGDLAAFAEAVAVQRDAVAATRADDPLRSMILANLAITLNAWFLATGDLAHVADAIEAARQAVETGTGDRARWLGILAAVLDNRFRATGELPVLAEAVDTARESVRLGAQLVAGQAERISNFGTLLSDLYSRTGKTALLDEAIEAHRAAVDATADDDPARAFRLANLGGVLETAYNRAGDRQALRAAVAARRASVAATPVESPDWVRHTASLAGALGDWFANPAGRKGGTGPPPDPDVLAEAVTLARQVAGRTEAHDRAGTRTSVANVLALRFRHFGDQDALTEALGHYREAVASAGSPAKDRAEAADRWGALAAEAGQFAVAAEGYAAAAGLLPQLAGRLLNREDAQYWLGRYAGIAADAAACALAAGDAESAVTLLESGRCVLAAQVLDGRGDLSELRDRAPELADRFEALTGELETDTARDRLALARELDDLTGRIRALPGMARFLRPPLLADLTAQAGEGPVVYVNVSRHRCDALILTREGVRARELPGLSEEAVGRRVRAFHTALTEEPEGRLAAERTIHETLEWLWDTVASPVLDALQFAGPPADGGPWPRIWWAPVGSLSLLPLHAAGHHRDGGPVLLDRVVSSTTPTIRALGYARASRPERTEPRLLVVAMPETPDAPDLPGARAEAGRLASRVPGATVLTGPDATRDAVLRALPANTWAHFACHGYSDPDNPSDSHLALFDHERSPLRVPDLSRLRLRHAEFAFLSACDTARTTERLSDEAIHPLSALQIAGFSQVVGTLWRIDDAVAPSVTEQIYDELFTAGPDAASAVHRTVLRLKERYPNLPSLWAAYVHTGA
ncbi:CHAT domain-containing protein [Amycolatopsis sp. NPDC098790]|uniref:CHAT domain-containing protein n=1 Tax=Amycolatopsis sp. NPDC098790 TaxID=3363939 RepID=UPI0037F7AC1E